MAEKKSNQSWNPLNYSQNLCVVSNPSIGSDESSDSQLIDPMSGLDLNSQSNQGMHRFVNDLISNNDNDLQIFNSNQTINPFIAEDMRAKTANNVLNCGDFALNGRNRLNESTLPSNESMIEYQKIRKAFESLSYQSSDYPLNPNPSQMLPNSVSSERYAETKSFAKQMHSLDSQQLPNQFSQTMNNRFYDSIKNSLISSLTNPLPKQISHSLTDSMSNPMNTSLSSGMMSSNASQSSVMQSIIGQKSQTFAYNPNQSYQQMTPFMDPLAGQEASHTAGRQMRSIRSRNAVQNPIEPINNVNYYLDKSYEQFKHLEKERKKIEYELIQAFVGQKISSSNNIPIQRLPQNATKTDRIITDMSREHAKVITIVAKMEQLKGRELSEAIHNSFQKWVDIIRDLQMKRKYEVQGNGVPDQSFVVQIFDLLKQLVAVIRSVRTGLWSASVLTLYDQTFV